MITLLLATSSQDALSGLESGLKTHDKVEVFRTDACQKAFDWIAEKSIDLVVADETIESISGIEFARKLISVNPMVPCAVVSALSSADFHEASEGLGVLMQLPVNPDRRDAQLLMDRLTQVLNLTAKHGAS